MSAAAELTQPAQQVKILIPLPQGEEFRERLGALAAEYGLVVGEGPEYVPAEVSGAGMRGVSGD